MKVLILVQSINPSSKPEYEKLRQTQLATWDSIIHPDVDVIYYTPGVIPDKLEGNQLHIFSNTHWTHMFFTLAKAMRHMLKHDMSWDYIFKTDNTAYIDKAKLHEILSTKPREKYYGGMLSPFKTSDNKLVNIMWGDGYALSRDMVAYLVSTYNKAPFKGKQEDDVTVSYIMQGIANWDSSLSIYTPNEIIEPGHHAYRCRVDHTGYYPGDTPYTEISKVIDIDNIMMNKVHNKLTNGQTDNSKGILEEIQD
jgi:hypothetical protein